MVGRICILICGSLALAACGGDAPAEGEAGEISMAEAANIAKSEAVRPDPGQYRVTMKVLEFGMPGAPPQAAAMMKGMMEDRSHTYCLTEKDVEQGFEQMAKQSQDNGDCSFEKFDVDGGNFDGVMVCNAAGQGTMRVTMSGTGTPTRSVMDTKMTGKMAGTGEMTIRMQSTHERIGDCP